MAGGKTETIKERAVYVYLPSHEMVGRWKGLAREGGTSVSKFVVEHVEDSLRRGEAGFVSRVELSGRVRELEEEVSGLRREGRMLRLLSEKLDAELKHYRARPFLEEGFEGVRSYWREVVEALRRRGFVATDELLDILGVEPRDSELVKAISRQMENLEAYGLVEATPRGWRWVG